MKTQKEKIIIVIASISIVASFVYNAYLFYKTQNDKNTLEKEKETLDNALRIAQKNYITQKDQKEAILVILGAERQNSSYIQNQIQDITSTVGQLKKLSQTDVELLKKYSKVYFLNENYIPKNLIPIDAQYLNNKNKNILIVQDIYPKLKKMLDDARLENIDLQILSGYRSFSEQESLKSSYKVTYGYGANKFSADQGYSEHQLGTTIDFTTSKIGGVLSGFEKTEAYKWLNNNAYKYGFAISYPKNNNYYIFEPWHWRFVGISLAKRLHDENLYFYDTSQRDIDQYLGQIFD